MSIDPALQLVATIAVVISVTFLVRWLMDLRPHRHRPFTMMVVEWDTSSTLHSATKLGYICSCGTVSIMAAPPLR